MLKGGPVTSVTCLDIILIIIAFCTSQNFVFLANEQENSTNTAEDGTDMGHEKNSKEKGL